MISMFDLSNLKIKIQHAKNGFKFASFDNSYTLFFERSIWPVAYSLSEVSWVTAETLCSHWVILRDTKPVSGLVRALLHIAAFFLFSFLHETCQVDLNRNMNIRLPLF